MKKHESILLKIEFGLMAFAIVAIALECLFLKTGHLTMAMYADSSKDLSIALMAPGAFMLMPSLLDDEDEEA